MNTVPFIFCIFQELILILIINVNIEKACFTIEIIQRQEVNSIWPQNVDYNWTSHHRFSVNPGDTENKHTYNELNFLYFSLPRRWYFEYFLCRINCWFQILYANVHSNRTFIVDMAHDNKHNCRQFKHSYLCKLTDVLNWRF